MLEDYQDLVLAAYKKMREHGKLHAILPQVTTTRIKRACLKVYGSRNNPNDIDILSTFFKMDEIECNDFREKLKDSEPDDYRPLWNHITNETDKTEERNTDLLAWLIDLEPRPSSSYYLSTDKTIKIGGISIDDLFIPPITKTPPPILTTPPKTIYIPRFSPRYITVCCIILLVVSTISFFAWERSTLTIRMPKADEKFMYWDEDHYEPVRDEKQNVDATIIPINIKTLTQQTKINLPDTITSYSLGKVWYKGHGKDHEFFTDSGAYPLDLQRVLKPLSINILTKYTSNYRYYLTRLVWFLCAAFLISIGGYLVSRMKRKISVDKQDEPSADQIPDFFVEELAE